MKPTRIVPVALTALLAAGAARGIEPGDLDRTADPCTDFFAFANGAWRAANLIPPGQQRWSRRLAAGAENRRQLGALLQELASRTDRPRGSVEQQLGDHFGSCMDEAAIDAAGVTPLAPLLAEIAGVRDPDGVQRVIRRLHDLAIPVPFALTAASAYQDPALVVANVAASGLGLSDRDDYLKTDAPSAEKRERYRAHAAAVLALGGTSAEAAQKASAEVLAFETRLAEASLAPAAASDPTKTDHPHTFAQLVALAPRVDWDTYFAEAGLPRADVNVAEPAFLARVSRELEATPVVVWKAYLTWHLLESASPWLARPFADESFAFRDQYLGGASEPKPRAARCLESTETLLGEPLGRVYAERYFPPAAKAKVQEMVRELMAVLKDDVGRLEWMAPVTRQQALAKLAAYDVKVGYPDEWTDHAALVIRRHAFWANVAAGRRFGVEASRRRVGQRTGRAVWQLPPSSPLAYIDVQLNQIALPAGFLQGPAFDLARTDASNYGAVGIGIAHDLTHAIDPGGAEFDADGRPRNWWTDADRQAFAQRAQCVADQYEGYVVEPGLHQDGRRVMNEAVGDLAGVRLAYRALQRSQALRPAPVVDGFTAAQQFFLAWGQYRGVAESSALQRQMVASDSHAVARYRVMGPLATTPEFQQAFACKPGSAMVREPRCVVW
jgi:putative endopeptidase